MKVLIVSVIASIALSGCAFTVHDVAVNYKYAGEVSVNLQGASVAVAPFTDSRGASNPRMLMHMKNLNGDTTSGGWQAEKPLADIARDGVIQALEAAKAAIRPSSNVELSGQLQDFSYEAIMGMWEGELKGKLLLKLELKQVGSGEVIWKDTFVGNASVKGGAGAEGLFRQTLSDALNQLMSDKYFLQKLSPRGT
jgi:hypothetical protein